MSFNQIIAHERAKTILRGTLKRNRVPSAVLFSGDEGIGKKLTAITYAKALNCLEPVEGDCCDSCRACKKIDSGMHPDVTVVSPEKDEITIENIRMIIEALSWRPFEGKRKVFIIDDADAMNSNAANAFLKTLEEPPEGSLILLVSSSPDRLPDTIKSRCAHIRFYPLPRHQCEKIVSPHLDQEKRDVILNSAMGRPGLALSRDFTSERDRFMKILNNMIDGTSKDGWGDKDEMKLWFEAFSIFLRDLAVFNITGQKSDLIYGQAHKKRDIKEILDAYQLIDSLKSTVDFNLNKSITWNYVSAIARQYISL